MVQKVVAVTPEGDEVEMEVTLGVAEALAMMKKGARFKTVKELIEPFVDPPEAVDAPHIFFKLIEAAGEAILYHYRRSERLPAGASDGPTVRPDLLSKVFSAIEYAFANKLNLSPIEARRLPIDEAFDYIIMMKAEGQYLERMKRRAQRGVGGLRAPRF